MQTPKKWTSIAQRIQAISQTGIAFAQNAYDVKRYTELSDIAAEMMAGPEPEGAAAAKRLFAAEAGYATPKVDVRGAVFSERARLAGPRIGRQLGDVSRRMGRGGAERGGIGRA